MAYPPDAFERALAARRKPPPLPGSRQSPIPGGNAATLPPGTWVSPSQTPFEGVKYPAGYGPTPAAPSPAGGPGGPGAPFVDPGYQQFLANLRAMGALDASQRQTAIQQALVRFGLVPGGIKDPYGDVTDLVRGLASEKTTAGLSTYARIQDWSKQILSRLKKALAARGALRSGELGFGLERQDLGYRQTFDDAVSQLLDYISGAQSAFAQSELGRTMQQAQGAQSFFDPGNFFAPQAAPAPLAAPAPSPAFTLQSPFSSVVSSPTSVIGGGSLARTLFNQTPRFSGIRPI